MNVSWQQLLEMTKDMGRDEAFALIDQWTAARPELTQAGNYVKSFLDSFVYVLSQDDKLGNAFAEVLALIAKGEGPVTTAPEVDLV